MQFSEPLDWDPLPISFDRSPDVGEELTIIGYGGNGPDDEFREIRRRRRTQVRVIHVGELVVFGRRMMGDGEFSIEGGACSGDSGGPALDAEGRIVGVVSRGGECAPSVYTSVAHHGDWLRSEVRDSYVRRGQTAPPWLDEGPQSLPGSGSRAVADAAVASPPSDAGVIDPPLEMGAGCQVARSHSSGPSVRIPGGAEQRRLGSCPTRTAFVPSRSEQVDGALTLGDERSRANTSVGAVCSELP